MKKIFSLFVLLVFTALSANAQTFNYRLITDDTWKSSNMESIGWEQPSFDDADWSNVILLGLDAGIVQFSPPPNLIWNSITANPNITYFRKTFTMTDISGPVIMDYSVDDDAEIYINGVYVTADNDCWAIAILILM